MLHVMLATLTAVAAEADPPPLPSVAIDMARLDRERFEALERAGIYQSLVVRLVGEHLALVDTEEHADVVLHFEAKDGRQLLVTAASAASSARELVVAAPLADEQVRLGVVHAAVGLVRQTLKELAPPASLVTASAKSAEPVARVALTAANLWSAGAAGLLGEAVVGKPLGPIELGAGLVVHRPLQIGPRLDMLEWGAFAGLGTSWLAVAPRIWLQVGMDVGIWQQRFSYADASGAADRGTRLDAASLLHTDVVVDVTDSLRVGATGGVLATRHDHLHKTATDVLWQAPRLRPYLGMTIGFLAR